MRTLHYKHTIRASYIGYMVQSLINTFAPLLFVTFQKTYEVSLVQVSFLIAANFGAQIILDMVAALLADRIGYRKCIITAHVLAAAGLIGLAVFPEILPHPFAGLLLAVIIYGSGGGLTEVLLTPIVQACPVDNKDQVVSTLHSFYCWGGVIVIIASSVFFQLAGIGNWKILTVIWALVPICNAIYFARVPIYQLVADEEKMPFSKLASSGVFWLLLIFMFCAGACEMSIAQWASDFAEEGLHVSKAIGDLAGPCTFAAMKGIERTIYGKKGDKIPLWAFMVVLTIACGVCYLIIGFSGSALVALVACAIAGFANGVMWPGTFSMAGEVLPTGGTAMFGFLALFGDLGCGAGPMLTGFVSSVFGGSLRAGFLFGALFSVLMLAGLLILLFTHDKKHIFSL